MRWDYGNVFTVGCRGAGMKIMVKYKIEGKNSLSRWAAGFATETIASMGLSCTAAVRGNANLLQTLWFPLYGNHAETMDKRGVIQAKRFLLHHHLFL